MAFMDLSPRRRRWRIIDHGLIVLALIGTIVTFSSTNDPITGKPDLLDALGFSSFFLALSEFIICLPTCWRVCAGTRLNSLIPTWFIFLTLAYFYLGFRSYFIQPGPTGISIGIQLVVLIGLASRIG